MITTTPNGQPHSRKRLTQGNSTAEYRQAQQILWGEAGTWAHDTLTELNADFFTNEIPHRGIAWGLTPHGSRLGHTDHNGRITLHPALLDPHSDAWRIEKYLGEGYARDVLLHEMIHALFRARDLPSPGPQGEHNTEAWCREVVRLAPLLGLRPVQAAPVQPRRQDGHVVRQHLPGHLTRRQIATFPHSLRPKAWYEVDRGRMPVPI